jgi:hypothetical protein
LRYTKGDKPAGSAGRAQAAPEKNRQRWLRIHKGRRKQTEKDVVDSMKRGRRGSGAGVSARVPEAGLGRSTNDNSHNTHSNADNKCKQAKR